MPPTLILFAYSDTTLKLKPAAAQQFSDEDSSPATANRNEGSLSNVFYETSLHSKSFSFSLELCTENLGCETGCDGAPSAPSIAKPSDSRGGSIGGCRPKIETRFPPLLTTMTGASRVELRSRREGGRLIVDAVEAPFRNCRLQAERTEGRLKLSLPMVTAAEDGEEMGPETVQRPTRCKERNHEWKQSVCVVIS